MLKNKETKQSLIQTDAETNGNLYNAYYLNNDEYLETKIKNRNHDKKHNNPILKKRNN